MLSVTVTLVMDGQEKKYGSIDNVSVDADGMLTLSGKQHSILIASGMWVECYSVPMTEQAETVTV